MSADDPAFPVVCEEPEAVVFHGVTKREYFAGQLMAGLMANQIAGGWTANGLAKVAVGSVDALIAALDGRSDVEPVEERKLADDLAAARRHAAALQAKLDAIHGEIEGYIDGAPDAGPTSKLANGVARILEGHP